MNSSQNRDGRSQPADDRVAVEHLRRALVAGRDWPTALLEAMALWTAHEETYDGRHYSYFIAGEAFDWLTLAERLCCHLDGVIPEHEKEELLFRGAFPASFDQKQLQHLIGVDKYRGYLNYFYGVTVEEALQLAVEGEVQKRYLSNGNHYRGDFSEEAFVRIYGAPKSQLLRTFWAEHGRPMKPSIRVTEDKEFTYWLFKYRIKTLDKAKVASDTRKGLGQLQRMLSLSRAGAVSYIELPLGHGSRGSFP